MTPSSDVPVIITPRPFDPRLERITAPAGVTVAQILLEAVKADYLLLDDLPRTAVYIDGERVDRRTALDVRLEAGQVVNVAVEPAGGGSNEDAGKAAQVLLQIAVVAVSIFVGPWWGLAVALVGQGIINAAWGPKTPDRLADANDRRALQDASNEFRPRGPMPLMLGSGRAAFDIAAMPYTSNDGDDVYLRLIFGVHYGPCQVTDIKIGETLLEDYPASDYAIEYFLNGETFASTIYPEDVNQENLSDELIVTRTGDPIEWEVHTAPVGVDRIELDFSWPSGLRFNKDNGSILRQQVQLVIETAPVGTEFWASQSLEGAPYYDWHGVAVPTGNFYVDARTNDAVRRTVAFEVDSDTQWKIRVRAFDPDNDDADKSTDSTYWTAVRSIIHGSPVVDSTLSTIVLKLRSSDDLNGTLPTVTGVVTPIVPVWNGSVWTTPAPTGNFAACARWLVTGPAAASPLTAEQVDDSFGAQFDLIEAQGWTGLIPIREETSQEDALRALGMAGRFFTYWNGRALVCVPDWIKATPRQLFTGRNAQGYRFRRTFPDALHAVMVEFRDLEGQDDEVFVYAAGYGPENAEIIETIRPGFACDIDRAYRFGALYLFKRENQTEVHEWSAGWDALATTLGDRVLVRHPSALVGIEDGQVVARRWAGSLVAGVRLDQPVTMEEGQSYALDVRRADMMLRGLAVVTVPGETRVLTFATPLPEEDAPARGDLFAFGELNFVTEDVEVVDVDASSDFAATIRAVPYLGPQMVALEAEALPTGLASSLVPKEPPPVPRVIMATGNVDGAVISFEVDPVRGNFIAGFSVWWRRSPDVGLSEQPEAWIPLPTLPPAARQVKTPPLTAFGYNPDDVDSIVEIDVQIRTIFRSGAISLPGYALFVAGYRFVPTPTGFEAVAGTQAAGGGSGYYPVIALSADPVPSGPTATLEVQIRPSLVTGTESGIPEDWTYLAGLDSANPVAVKRVNGPAVYDIRARWRTFDNWNSLWVYENELEVTLDQYDTPQVVEGALFRITSDQDVGSQVTIPSRGSPSGHILIKTMAFEVDDAESKFTIHLSSLYESSNSNISYIWLKIGQIAPVWATSGSADMTNADKTYLVTAYSGPVTVTFSFSGLNPGINTLEIHGGSTGSGSHSNTMGDNYFQVREDKKAS